MFKVTGTKVPSQLKLCNIHVQEKIVIADLELSQIVFTARGRVGGGGGMSPVGIGLVSMCIPWGGAI